MATDKALKEDIETEHLTSRDQSSFVQRFEKIYFTNYKRINSLESGIKYLQIIAIFSGLLFLISITLVLSLRKHIPYAWVFSSIPLIIGIISVCLAINFFLNLTIIYNEGTSLASWMSLISINLASANFIIFLLCFSLKLEGVINPPWKLVTIPLYIIVGIALFYFIFMMPAFIDRESFWDIAIISGMIVNTFIFLILLNSRLENSYKLEYLEIFIPIWITLLIFYVYLIYFLIKDSNEFINNILNLIVNVIVTLATILIATNLDKVIITPYWISLTLLILAYQIFLTERLLAQFNIMMIKKKG